MSRTRQVFLSICIAAITACAWLVPLDTPAEQQVDAGMRRALTSFATARALNAFLSVVAGTEFAAQPAGIGIKFSVGQVLRPINDVVETFADLMLVASISFGIEKILINIGAHWLMSLALTAVAVAWGYLHRHRSPPPKWVTNALIVLLMARFAVPVAILGSDLLFQHFMAADYASSQSVINDTTEQLTTLVPAATQAADDRSLWDKLKQWGTPNLDIKARLAKLGQSAEQATERMVKLMVIFVLQTLLLPVLLLWVLWTVAKGAFEVRARPAGRMSEPAQASS